MIDTLQTSIPPDLSPERIRAAIDAVVDRRTRVDMMLSYADRLFEYDPERAFELAAQAQHIASLRQDRAGIAGCYWRMGRARAAQRRFGEAIGHFRKSIPLFDQLGDHESLIAATRDLARSYLGEGEYTHALAELEIVLRHFESRGNREGIADALDQLGDFFADIGDNRQALDHALRSLALRREIDDPTAMAVALSNVGAIYGQLGEVRRSRDAFEEALAVLAPTGNRMLEVRTLVNLVRAHTALDELDAAQELAFKSLAIYEELGDRESLPAVLSDIGSIYERRGDLEPALDFHLKALTLLEGREPGQLELRVLLSIGSVYQRIGLNPEAANIAGQALSLAQELGDREAQYQLHRTLAAAFEALDRPAEALDHFKRYASLREEVHGIEMQRAVAEMQLRSDVERAVREKEIYRLKAEQLEAEADRRKGELAAMALNLIEKNTLLEQVREQVEHIAQGEGVDRRTVRTVLTQISDAVRSDDRWKSFEQQLNNLHEDFTRKLSERCDTLTPKEIQICSLVKLNLSSKEIAELTGNEVKTIENHRHRIKKKIEPDSDRSLAVILAAM